MKQVWLRLYSKAVTRALSCSLVPAFMNLVLWKGGRALVSINPVCGIHLEWFWLTCKLMTVWMDYVKYSNLAVIWFWGGVLFWLWSSWCGSELYQGKEIYDYTPICWGAIWSKNLAHIKLWILLRQRVVKDLYAISNVVRNYRWWLRVSIVDKRLIDFARELGIEILLSSEVWLKRKIVKWSMGAPKGE